MINFRREVGYCRVCFSADNVANVDLSGKADAGGVVKGESCCAYGTKGTKTTGVYDCLMIPAATKTGGGNTPSAICGGNGGIVTAAGTTGKTVCCKCLIAIINILSIYTINSWLYSFNE